MKRLVYWTMKEEYWQRRLADAQRRALLVCGMMGVCIAIEYWLGL
ncbi:hypothetical protein [Hymenobacter cavernae]|nr:hypothetical protein [Hymenobacter cavernae]